MNNKHIFLASSTIGLVATVGFLSLTSVAPSSSASASPPLAQQVIQLTGVVRDFKERTKPGGHPDFERQPAGGFGQYSGNVAQQLGEDGKPVWTGNGKRVTKQWATAGGRPICYSLYSALNGDKVGTWGTSDTGGVQSAETFNQWFNDVPGVNLSMPLTVNLVRQADGSYVFDDKLDPAYDNLSGFFPIEGQLFGNPGGSPNRNFHFTFELHTHFTYNAALNQTFRFIGDDDVWVFINGKKVIDLGGVHGATEQYVELNRLGLEDGGTYPLDFFFAERHRTESNFRIQTNLILETAGVPTTTTAFD